MTDPTCSEQSKAIAEPLAGTAPTQARLLIVEQPGPWGAKALQDSRLLPSTRDSLVEFDARPGHKVLLARRDAAPNLAQGRNVWFLERIGAAVISRHAVLPVAADPTLLDTDHAGAPDQDATQVPFICTNSARDKCCALLGRKTVANLPDAWQVSHVGGHRFAPTGLSFPSGIFAGRMPDPKDWSAADGPPLQHTRGRMGREPWQQAAEIAVAELTGAPLSTFDSAGPASDVQVSGAGGMRWHVTVQETTLPPRQASCTKPAEEPKVWLAGQVHSGV
ncbi:hypothetical protein N9D66_00540 [Candidatus Nanopelagicales bacterium]|nr:hypothetical protein [Candidatus Nanopelagicales bacterium]